jgi:dimethylglycine dehydrogenase
MFSLCLYGGNLRRAFFYVFLTPDEIKARWPLIETLDLKGAFYHNTDGYIINPADDDGDGCAPAWCMNAAGRRRVSLERHPLEVTATVVEKGGNLVPSDEQIVITAGVVTASGNHAQRTAKMLGIKIPADSRRTPVHRDADVDPALQECSQDQPRTPLS